MAANKRVYVVSSPNGVEYVRAISQAGAIAEVARKTITARAAKVEDVIGVDPAKIIEAGQTEEA